MGACYSKINKEVMVHPMDERNINTSKDQRLETSTLNIT